MPYFLFLLCLLSPIFISAQLLPNGGFEIDNVAPFGKPDFYRFRMSNFHELETDTVRHGSYAARFNNTGPTRQSGYYYSHYDAAGSASNFLSVAPGETYEFSFYYRTAVDFVGSGVGAQLLFSNEQNQFVGNVNIDPYRTSIGQWTKMYIRGTIPSGVCKISTGIYYEGIGKAWIDDAELIRIGEPPAPNLSFETDTIAPFNIPDNYKPRFQDYHFRETNYDETYLGYGAAKFNNNSSNDIACYYYGNYSGSGTVREGIPVHPNDRYRFTGFTRTAEDFFGSGMSLSAIFFDSSGQFVARHDSPKILAPDWDKIDFEITVPYGATHMIHSTEYRGKGEAWFDNINIQMTNPLINSGFESDVVSPLNQPDFWKGRFSSANSVAGLETNPALVYSGQQCAKFESDVNAISYYYGPYDITRSQLKYISVRPGQQFELKAQTKTSSDFVGSGLKISLLFWIDDNFHSRKNSGWIQNDSWTEESLLAAVPHGVNNMTVSIEFYGQGTAWYDNVELNDMQNIWYLREASIDDFEPLAYAGSDLVPLEDMIERFKYHDTIMETYYNDDGTWGVGYSCQPLIRISANAALGYLNTYSVIPNPRYLQRAYEALDYLVADQKDNGAFIWYSGGLHGNGTCGSGSLSAGAVMYEGGIAGAALIKGYEMSGDVSYLEASNKFCQYLALRPPNPNANPTGFAIWALSENYRITSNPVFLETALIYFESLHSFQLNSGMWSDQHNQYIHYHGIILRGIANLQRVMPPDHPKTEVIRHAAYKGINHIIRSQRPGGLMQRFPSGSSVQNSLFSLDPMVIGWDKAGYSNLTNQINEYTTGAKSISPEVTQGHQFASLGLLFYHYYQNQADCPDDYADSNKLTGIQNSAVHFQTSGRLESDQQVVGPLIHVTYDSDISAELLPGFSVENTVIFEVLLTGCDD